MNFRQHYSLMLSVLLALMLIVLYGNFLSSPMIFDDPNVVNDASLQYFYATPFEFQLRWFAYASLAWTKHLFGLDLIYYRVGNLAIHVATCAVLFVFLQRLYGRVLSCSESGIAKSVPIELLALFGTAFFALNPVAVYGVAYLVERSISMATLFMLLMLLSWLEGMLRGRSYWFYFSAIFYLASVFSKEHSIMAPVLLPLLMVLLREHLQAGYWKKMLVPFFLMAIFGSVALLASRGVIGHSYEINAKDMLQFLSEEEAANTALAYPLSVLTQSYLYFKYLLLWLIPSPSLMSVDMREPLAKSLLSWPYTLGFVCFLLYPVVAFKLLYRRGVSGLIGFAMLFPYVLFATELVTVRLQESFVLYRSYLWVSGFSCLIPLLLLRVRTAMVIPVVSGVCIFLMIGTWDRLITFSNPFSLWQDAAQLVEGRPYVAGTQRIFYNRGNAYFFAEKYPEAIADYTRAIDSKERAGILSGLQGRGNVYFHLERYDLAFADFSELAKREPKLAIGYYGRGRIYEKLGRGDLAQLEYEISCRLGNRGCERLTRTNEVTLPPSQPDI